MFEVYLWKSIYVIGILFASLVSQFLVNAVLNFYSDKILKRTKTKFDEELYPLIKRLLNIVIWCTGLIIILFEFGVLDLSKLAATVGISSILIAMLVKESVSNIVAGITIMFDRPFRAGDKIKLSSGDVGEVLKIGLRRTHILIPRTTEEVSILIIPNKDLTKSKIYNYTYAKELKNEKKEDNPIGNMETD